MSYPIFLFCTPNFPDPRDKNPAHWPAVLRSGGTGGVPSDSVITPEPAEVLFRHLFSLRIPFHGFRSFRRMNLNYYIYMVFILTSPDVFVQSCPYSPHRLAVGQLSSVSSQNVAWHFQQIFRHTLYVFLSFLHFSLHHLYFASPQNCHLYFNPIFFTKNPSFCPPQTM